MTDEKEGASQHPPQHATTSPIEEEVATSMRRLSEKLMGDGLYPPFVPSHERVLHEATEHALKEGIGVIEVVSVGDGYELHGRPSAEVVTPPMVVGDLSSDEPGTGARANSDKVQLDLLPLAVVAESLTPNTDAQRHVKSALMALGTFQAGGGPGELRIALVSTAMAAGMTLQQLFDEAADVLEYGKGKYAPFNWAKGMSWSVCIGCAARHLLQKMWVDPQSVDDESGSLHAGHVACNLIFLLQYAKTYREGDDRPPQLARVVQGSTL